MVESLNRRETGIPTENVLLDQFCDEFERLWLGGRTPTIEDALREWQGAADRDLVLRELLHVEFELRVNNGGHPRLEEYVGRFPDREHVVREAFRSFSGTKPTTVRDGPTKSNTRGRPAQSPTPVNLPGYTVLGELGRGGMGVVLKARQDGLDRVVALKTIRSGELASPEEVKRFLSEANSAARLDHPNIVPIHEIGEQGGLHYFSMGFVDGPTLQEVLADGVFSPDKAARLTQTLAEAVHYAHENGIVHRDLKPGNVLLDANGEPRITDFGLAKQTETNTAMTATGQVLGTPSYMPPEQAAADNSRIGPHSDVYSLGAILYALLTGRPPFQAASMVETLKQVVERDPVSPRQLNPEVGRDLETVCLKCLEKEPAKRYASSAEFRDELQRLLDGRPILVRPATWLERVVKWARRKPLAAGMMTTIAAAVIAVVSTLAYAYVDVANSRDLANDAYHNEQVQRKLAIQREGEARAAQEQSEADKKAMRIALVDLHTNSGITQMERGNLPEAALWAAYAAELTEPGTERSYVNRVRARLWRRRVPIPVRVLWHDGKPLTNVVLHQSGRYLIGITNDNECYHCDIQSSKRLPVPGGRREITAARWNPNGDLLALGTQNGDVVLYRYPGGQRVRTIRHNSAVRTLAFSSDGRRLCIAGKSVRVWDVAGGSFVTDDLVHPKEVLTVEFSAKGDRLLTACVDDFARIFHLRPTDSAKKPILQLNHELRLYPLQRPIQPRFVEDDTCVLTLPALNRAVCVDVKTGQPRRERTITAKDIYCITASPDSKHFAIGGFFGGAMVWTAGKWIQLPMDGNALVQALQFSPDSATLVTADEFGTVTGWNLKSIESAKAAQWRVDHTIGVTQVVFSDDGKRLVTVQKDGLIRIWDTRQIAKSSQEPLDQFLKMPGKFTEIKFSRDGRYLLRAGASTWWGTLRSVRVYDLKTLQPVSPEVSPGELVLDAAMSPDGRQIVSGDARKKLRFWDRETGREMRPVLVLPSEPRAIEYLPKGQKIVCLCVAGEVLRIDVATGKVDARWQHGTEGVKKRARFKRRYRDNAYFVIKENGVVRPGGAQSGYGRDFMRLTDDGRWLIASRLDQSLSVRNTTDGALRYPLIDHGAYVNAFHLSADEQFLATGSRDGSVKIWNFTSGKQIGKTISHPDVIESVRFSPDAGQIVTACRDSMVRLWDWRKGKLSIPPTTIKNVARIAVFTPDGRWIAAASRSGNVAVWDRETGRPALVPFHIGGTDKPRLAVTPDQSQLLISGHGKGIHAVSLSDFAPEHDVDLRLLGEIASNQTIEKSGVVNLTTKQWLDRWKRYRKARPVSKQLR